MKSKGILLIALGHHNYGRMALNLAVSIKITDPTVNIAIAFAGNALNDIQHYPLTQYFDQFISVPEDAYTRNGKTEWIKAKTWMYELSPFDETIFLDVDMIWHPVQKISSVFESLKGVSLTFQNRGFIDMADNELDPKYSLWADVNEIKNAYKFKGGKYYQLHSEFVFFRKNKTVKKFFDTAREVYDNLKVKSFAFGGAIPDELPFGISMIMNNIYPHADNYVPVYWEVTEKKNMHRQQGELYKQFVAYSTGGSFHSNTMKSFYNNLAKFYFNQAGLQYPYFLQNKRDYVPERINL